jgi:hypothetical protein
LAIAVVLIVAFSISGCGLILDTTFDQAVVEAEVNVGEQVAAGMMAPVYRAYALSLMAAYFWAGGYWLSWHPYQPGEWTKWSHEIKQARESSQQQPLFVEKAFLKRNDDGSEWWRVKAFQQEEKDTFVFEALFSPDKTQIVSMRAKMGDNPVEEVTFEEGENSFPAPSMFDEQVFARHRVGSLEMALGFLDVSAEHIRFSAPDGSGQVDFYFSKNVPGGLVKYHFMNQQGDTYTLQIAAHGTDATTELGSY